VSARANGESSVYLRQDGRWSAAAYVLRPDGGASPSTGVRADACRGQPEVDGSAVQDGGGEPIGGGGVDGALVRRSLAGDRGACTA
jgi:hypothetical protein